MATRGELFFSVRALEDAEDFVEGVAQLGIVTDVDRKSGVAVLAGGDVTIREENVGKFLAVVGAGFYAEGGKLGWTKKS